MRLRFARRRRTLAAALVPALVASSCAPPPPPTGPHVLLVSLDSVRADALTFLDEESAPNLTRLARRGVVFGQALTGTSWTLPAHAQMFTGSSPVVHGVYGDDVRIDPHAATLPELLREAGWWTAGFWTGWFLAGDYGFERGFALYQNSMTRGQHLDEELRRAREEGDWALAERTSSARELANHEDVTSESVVANLRAALAAVDGERATFLFAHLFDPHFDYVPPAPFDELFDPDYTGDLDGRGYWHNLRIRDPKKDPARQVSDRDLEHIRALYRGEIAWTDQAVGEILDELEASGRLADTLVIVTADHGEEFFEHGNRGHRRTLYDEVLRVPLLIVPPGSLARDAPRTSDLQVTLSDIAPTILDYVGLPAPPGTTGRSLRPILEGGELPARPAVSSLTRMRHREDGPSEPWITHGLRTPAQKLLRTFTLGPNGRPNLRGVAWYDLVEDPGEERPVSELDDPRLRAAWQALEAELDLQRETWAALPHATPAERSTLVRDAFARDLSSLGYAEGAAGDAGTGPLEPLLRPLPRLELPPPGR